MKPFTESIPGIGHINATEQYVALAFTSPLHTISNAPLHGGPQSSMVGLFNFKVGKTQDCENFEPPEITLEKQLSALNQQQSWVGMMTAASMKSLRYYQDHVDDYTLLCLVTTGLSNARRVGDPADYHETIPEAPLPAGTINLMFATDAPLSPAAQQEAFGLLIEAKTAACYDQKIKSPVSNKTATGTGTDVTVVASPSLHNPRNLIPYCGKHTLLGEKIGQCGYNAVIDSIQGCFDSE